jgi:ferritin heavy chain
VLVATGDLEAAEEVVMTSKREEAKGEKGGGGHQDGGAELQALAREQLKIIKKGQLGSAEKHFTRTDSYTNELEDGVNKTIAGHYTLQLSYDAMCAYFDRDNVGLPGSSYFFRILGMMERNDAQLFVDFNNRRGGTTIMTGIPPPEQEYMNHRSSADAKKDLQQAFEMTLANNRAVLMRLQELSQLALGQADFHMATFLGKCMDSRSELMHKVSRYLSQLHRLESGDPFSSFDRDIAEENVDMAQAAAYESAAPCRLFEGTMPRKKKRMNRVFEENFDKPTDRTLRDVVRVAGC